MISAASLHSRRMYLAQRSRPLHCGAASISAGRSAQDGDGLPGLREFLALIGSAQSQASTKRQQAAWLPPDFVAN